MSLVRNLTGRSCSESMPRLGDLDLIEIAEVVLIAVSTVCVFCFNFDTSGGGKTLTNLTLAMFILVEAVSCLFRGRIEFHAAVKLFGLFVLFCTASIFWSSSVDLSFDRVQSLMLMFGYFLALTNFLMVRAQSTDRLVFYARLLVVGSLISALYLLLTSGWQSGTRITGVIGDSNQASAYLSYSIPLALWCAARNLLPRWAIVSHVAVVGGAIVVMGSRTGLAVAVGGVVLYYLIRRAQKGLLTARTLVGVIGLVLLVGLVFAFIMTNDVAYEIIGSRFKSFFEIMGGESSSINENSYFERQRLAELAIQLFLDHPLLGVGIDAYASFAAQSIRDTFSHNDYLQLLSCVGVIGCALYYLQHAYILVLASRMSGSTQAMCITVLVQLLLFHAFVVFFYQKLEFVYLAFFVCLVLRASNRAGSVRTVQGEPDACR